MDGFTTHTGTALPLRRTNVDTDQIIPARYVPYFSRTGHVNALFADWRDDPSFPLNLPEHQGATIVVAGSDFGTGSSRESAVWALQAFGFVAVIAPRFGDIFLGNALLKGLLAVAVPTEAVERLWRLIDEDPSLPVTVDLERLQVRFADDVVPFELDEDARTRLRTGVDPIAATLLHAADIATFEQARRAALPTTVH
jgi:3-isopropylmalate/(R)-2-methylmalate dehydratase small subunit